MSPDNTCIRCGSANLEAGDLIDGFDKRRVLFRPTHKRFFTLRSGAEVTAYVCIDCGSVQMTADVKAVKALMKQENDEEPTPAESIECLECGAKIDAGESQCPKCGWTYTS